MLSLVGWLVVVWVIWTAIFGVTMWLIRFAMNGQQEFVGGQEAAITAAQAMEGQLDNAASAAPGSAPLRPALPERARPRASLGPPLSAT